MRELGTDCTASSGSAKLRSVRSLTPFLPPGGRRLRASHETYEQFDPRRTTDPADERDGRSSGGRSAAGAEQEPASRVVGSAGEHALVRAAGRRPRRADEGG